MSSHEAAASVKWYSSVKAVEWHLINHLGLASPPLFSTQSRQGLRPWEADSGSQQVEEDARCRWDSGHSLSRGSSDP